MPDPTLPPLHSRPDTPYTIERELGGGGMSRVLLARETALDRLVVIKLLPSDLMAGVSVERFRREIQLAARLQQANIVPVLAAGEMDGTPYYVMPFVEGESLRAHMNAHGALPIAETISLSRDMARALIAAHSLGVVHRDIKPENVLLSGGAAMITDFGIAKALHDSRSPHRGDNDAGTLTQLGTSLGTPAYMAPEQAAGDPDTDHRADLYAFGALMYEMLAGRPVFEASSAHALVTAHMSKAPEPLLGLRANVPKPLADLVMQCLAKDPAARPASAQAVLASLDALAGTHAGAVSPARALGIYAIACIALSVVAHFAITGIGLPTWVMSATLVIMALGLPATLFLNPRHSIRGGVGALGALTVFIAAYMILRAFGIGPVGSLFAQGVIKEQDAVIVSDFRAVNADSTFGAMLAEAVRTGLSQSKAIDVLTRAWVDTSRKRLGLDPRKPLDLATARQVARRDGAKAVVDGDVSGVAGGYVVSLRLVAAEDGQELAAFHVAAKDAQGLINAADELVRDLRGKIGESLRSVNAMPELSDYTTSSVDALREYSLGDQAEADGSLDVAVTHFREATRLDSNFAIAWLALSSELRLGQSEAAADSAVERAYALRDHLSHWEQLAITADYFAGEGQRDPLRATQAYQQMVDEGDSSELTGLATLLLNQRAYSRAEPIYRAELHVDPHGGDAVTRLNLSAVLFNEGKVAQAQAEFDSARHQAPKLPLLAVWGAELAYQRGDLATTQHLADSLRALPAPGLHVLGANRLADLALLRGQLTSYDRLRAEAMATDALRGNAMPPRAGAINRAYIDAWMTPTPERGAALLDSVLAKVPLDGAGDDAYTYYLVAQTYALAGKPDRARAIIARFDALKSDSVEVRLARPDRDRALGEIALAEKHWPQAIAYFEHSDTTTAGVPYGTCRMCVYAWLGHAYDEAGMADSAIAEYETYLRTPLLMRGFGTRAGPGGDPYMFGLVYRRLGDLYDKKGGRAKARLYYTRLADLWKNADPEFQPWVAAARARVRELGAG